MIYEVCGLPDADLGPRVDLEYRALRSAIRMRNGCMKIIEASRHGPPDRKLDKDTYIDFKIRHGNAEADADRARVYLRTYGSGYYSTQCYNGWMTEQHMMVAEGCNPPRPTLSQLWEHWHNVVLAWRRLKSIPVLHEIDEWGKDRGAMVSRQKWDAEVAARSAEGMYDLQRRLYEGRRPRTWEETLDVRPSIVSKPKHAPPPPRRLKSTPTKYVRGPNGTKIPRSKSHVTV